MMQEAQFHLDMTGGESVRFKGHLLASVSGIKHGGQDHVRWHDLFVYETVKGDIYVSVLYRTLGKRERDSSWYAALGHDPSFVSVATCLMQYDPLKRLLQAHGRTGLVDRRRMLDAAAVSARYIQRVGELIKAVASLHAEAGRR